MSTQEDRLLKNPNFAHPSDSRFSHLREIDFPDLLRKAMMIEIADRKGDWNLPSAFDSVSVPSGNVDEMERKLEKTDVEIEPEVETESIDEIKIESGTSKKVYTVKIVNGEPESCNCAAGANKRKCLHLEKAKKEYDLKQSRKLEMEDRRDTTSAVVVQMTKEEKMKLGGTHILRNTVVDPHGRMVSSPSGGELPQKPPSKESSWDVKPQAEIKPGSVIKI